MPAFDTGALRSLPGWEGRGVGRLLPLHDGGKRTTPRGIVRRVCAGQAARVSVRARDVRECANSGGAGWDGDVTAAPSWDGDVTAAPSSVCAFLLYLINVTV